MTKISQLTILPHNHERVGIPMFQEPLPYCWQELFCLEELYVLAMQAQVQERIARRHCRRWFTAMLFHELPAGSSNRDFLNDGVQDIEANGTSQDLIEGEVGSQHFGV
jgi:hypothetical protein